MKANQGPAAEICQVEASDLPEIIEIEMESFLTPWSKSSFLKDLTLGFSRFWAATLTEDGVRRIAGYVLAWDVEDEVHILKLATRRQYQRRGIARFLTERLLQECRQNGVRRATLEVRETNAAAQDFYRKLDFSRAGIRKGYYSDTGEDAILLKKDID